MSLPQDPSSGPVLPQLRVVAGSFIGGLIAIGVVATVIFPHSSYPPVWVPFALAGLAMMSYGASSVVGFPAPARDIDIERQAVASFTTGTFLRLALSEAVALVSLAVCFVLPERSAWPFYIGGVLAVVLIATQAWPGGRAIDKTQRMLDRNGVRIDLRSVLGGQPPARPIQRL